MNYKYAIVITGGIAVGKSTVKSLLSLYGFACIDADSISHSILDSSYKDISNLFGKKYIKIYSKSSNTPNVPYVDRKSLGEMIFKDKEKRHILEELIHPRVQEQIQKLAQIQENKKFNYFIDIPLFFERKNYNIKNSLVVYTPKDIQIKRLQLRDKFDYNQALSRIEAQIDIEKKKKLATYVIDNSKDLKYLQNECEIFAKKIEKLNI
jgi:dephospho-CoA kinase